jgi:hypothetical protein
MAGRRWPPLNERHQRAGMRLQRGAVSRRCDRASVADLMDWTVCWSRLPACEVIAATSAAVRRPRFAESRCGQRSIAHATFAR